MLSKPEAMRAQEAADLLGAHVETIRRLARRGEIPAFKVGKVWRFRRERLLQWAETHHVRDREPHVLILDDEKVVRDVLRGVLEAEGYRVTTASEGEAGLRSVAQVTPNLVILDLAMPGMNGLGFLGRFRPAYPETPVMIVTGYPDSELMAQALRYGPVTLLAKPVDGPQVLRAVHLTLCGALDGYRLRGRSIAGEHASLNPRYSQAGDDR